MGILVLILILIIIALCVVQKVYFDVLKQQLKDTKRELNLLQDKILEMYENFNNANK